MNHHIATVEVEGHMPRIRWAQDEQSHVSGPTEDAPHHPASPGRRILCRTLLATLLAALAVSVGVPSAGASIIVDGGIVEMSVACSPWSTVRTWGTTLKTSGKYVKFNYYVQSLSYPHLSGWAYNGDWPVMGDGTRVLGQIANRGSGQVKVYVQYAVWNGSAFQYYGEWIAFLNTFTPICLV